MILSLAPMEGLTGHTFRAVHTECFGALDRYYTPFLAPPHLGSGFGKRAMAELDPVDNRGLDVVPQLLTNDAERFIWGAKVLAGMGFSEVNLNLGCPSGRSWPRAGARVFCGTSRSSTRFWRGCAPNLPSRFR